MNELIQLSNSALLTATKQSVEKERVATLAVIDHLRDVWRRKLHLELGYESLHRFCVDELKFSDGAAFRRISAMRLCEDIPQAEIAISTGELSLSTAAQLQTHFRASRETKSYAPEQKLELMNQVKGLSRRECEKALQIGQPATESERICFDADQETMANLKRLSELLAIPASDSARLMKKITEIALKAVDPTLKKVREPKAVKMNMVTSPECVPRSDLQGLRHGP